MGWLRLDDTGLRPACGTHLESPSPFRFRVLRFFSISGEMRGVLGRVHEPRHPFDALYVVAWAGEGGPYGFERHLCTRWDVEVGSGPVLGQGWPRIQFLAPVHTGFGLVATSGAVVDETVAESNEDPWPLPSRRRVVASEYRVLMQEVD